MPPPSKPPNTLSLLSYQTVQARGLLEAGPPRGLDRGCPQEVDICDLGGTQRLCQRSAPQCHRSAQWLHRRGCPLSLQPAPPSCLRKPRIDGPLRVLRTARFWPLCCIWHGAADVVLRSWLVGYLRRPIPHRAQVGTGEEPMFDDDADAVIARSKSLTPSVFSVTPPTHTPPQSPPHTPPTPTPSC